MTGHLQGRIALGLGFVASIAGCVYLNYRSFIHDGSPIIDGVSLYGFPLPLYQQGGWAGGAKILWLGVSVDFAFALITGLFVGGFCKYLWIQTRPNQN